jgi:2-oxoglutarate ferredoxin oxidoreductase subunit alpha
MTATKTKEESKMNTKSDIVNDFSMTVATMNGSGSQTSNLTLLRALFKMGIPVSGKNQFPSNIQGLPTWYTIRVNKDGYTARCESHEIVVAMNVDTFGEDLRKVAAGGAFFYSDHLKFDIDREDISIYSFPAKQLAKESKAPSGLRDYVANMAYVGVLAQLLGIEMDKVQLALDFHFKGKAKPIDINMGVIEAAYSWAKENLEKSDPFRVKALDKTKDFVMADGNAAGALGAIYGGVQFASWYPITPASSVAEELTVRIGDLRDDPKSDEKTYAIVQAEDELSAIGMAIGAGWSGLRSMTSTSGPGISLMTEFVGMAYYAELPVVIWDVQRVGPSTGMPTRTSQGDILSTHFLGHGDTENILLLPSSPYECFEFGWKAFDISDRMQTPVFVMSDLDLGMNQWMTKPFDYPDKPFDRGKVLWEKDLEKLTERWGRYRDPDGDGIPYRTVPGNKNPQSAWFARGTGHDEYANYSENSQEWENNMARLKKKYETAKQHVPEPVVTKSKDAEIGIIAYGSSDAAILEAKDMLAKDGVKASYLRLRAVPFTDATRKFIEDHRATFVVEMNRDGQMHKLLQLDYPELNSKLTSLAKHDGMPLSARWVSDAVQASEGK